MRIGTVVVSAPEARYWLTTKSSIDSAKATSRLAAIAGASSGSSTRRDDVQRRRAEVGGRLLDVAPDRRQAPAHDQHDPRERERHLADHLRRRAQPDEAERGREEQEHADREDELGRHQRQQHQRRSPTPAPRPAPAPHARAPARCPAASRSASTCAASTQAVLQRRLQRRVVEDAERRVLPEPAQRPALQRRARAALVEGEADRQQHRQQRPQDVDPRVIARKRGRPHGLASRARRRATLRRSRPTAVRAHSRAASRWSARRTRR